MISAEVAAAALLLFLGTGVAPSDQRPFARKTIYKGLDGVVPSAQVFSSGLDRAVYYHDQTVAIVDIDEKNEIKNCNIIEVYERREMTEILKNLSSAARRMRVSFGEMTGLMSRCEQLDRMRRDGAVAGTLGGTPLERANAIGADALNLLSGILPGTKWCGTGDVARNYHDLGPEADIDSCCRSHDLCPVKIRAHATRYNLTNYSLYSKSHCACDNSLYDCLKAIRRPKAQIMGKLYFNVVRVECIEDESNEVGRFGGSTTKKFSSTGLEF